MVFPCVLSIFNSTYFYPRLLSEIVRRALQAQKGGDGPATESAEDALHDNKQFTELISELPAMVRLRAVTLYE